MPSPKAVLRDIHDLKLDPNVAHTEHDHTGRLRSGKAEFSAVHHVVKHTKRVAAPEPSDFPEVTPGIHTAPLKKESKVVEKLATDVKVEQAAEHVVSVVEEVKLHEEKVETKTEESKVDVKLETKVDEKVEVKKEEKATSVKAVVKKDVKKDEKKEA